MILIRICDLGIKLSSINNFLSHLLYYSLFYKKNYYFSTLQNIGNQSYRKEILLVSSEIYNFYSFNFEKFDDLKGKFVLFTSTISSRLIIFGIFNMAVRVISFYDCLLLLKFTPLTVVRFY